ncbi:MAG: hypothetical protein IBX52_13245 [Bacterioplanes sp.]|nr:hypothetical protein [Bacterioplanes sp.]
MDIIEQLESRVLRTIATVETYQFENQQLHEVQHTLQQTLKEREQTIAELQQQIEQHKNETVRLKHEKNEWESKVTTLLEMLDRSER